VASKEEYAALKGYVKFWKKSLGLENWKVNYRFSDDIKNYGRTSIYPMCSEIYMEFASPKALEDEECSGVGVNDLEVTVVHELLHVRFHFGVYHDKVHHDHVEMAIEATALSLVANRRGVYVDSLE